MPALAEVAKAAKIPVYVGADSMVIDGGLATIGVNYVQLGNQTAAMAVKVLEGTPVSEMPRRDAHQPLRPSSTPPPPRRSA